MLSVFFDSLVDKLLTVAVHGELNVAHDGIKGIKVNQSQSYFCFPCEQNKTVELTNAQPYALD